jgi:hypothetical protein
VCAKAREAVVAEHLAQHRGNGDDLDAHGPSVSAKTCGRAVAYPPTSSPWRRTRPPATTVRPGQPTPPKISSP